MKKINAADQLKEKIAVTEIELANTRILLKNDLYQLHESLKPGNLIRKTIQKLTGSSGIKDALIDTSIGMSAGFLSKKLILGSTHNPLMKIAGSLLQFGISNFVMKHPQAIKSAGSNILKSIFRKKEKHQEAAT